MVQAMSPSMIGVDGPTMTRGAAASWAAGTPGEVK